MNLLRTLVAGMTAALLSLSVAGQAQSTTLTSLVDEAEAVATVRVLRSTSDGTVRTTRLQTRKILAGQLPGVFELQEPAGRACGRALHGTVPGMGFLAFVTRRGQRIELAGSDARSLIRLTPGLLPHVRQLIATPPAERPALLASALAHADRRVAMDAAEALVVSRHQANLTARDRDLVAQALGRGLSTSTPNVPALLRVATNLQIDEAIDRVLPLWLDGAPAHLERPLRRSLDGFAPAKLAAKLGNLAGLKTASQHRALQLVATWPIEDARRPLEALLQARDSRVRRAAATAWIRAGATAAEMAPRVGVDMATAAARDASRVAPPTFRSIRPGR